MQLACVEQQLGVFVVQLFLILQLLPSVSVWCVVCAGRRV
jgi:hypothetical protein